MAKLAKVLKPWLGYIWLITVLAVSITGFMNMESVAEVLFVKGGFQVTENWRGGDIAHVKVHEAYQTIIHRPVFAGLLTEKNQGFIRIDWVSAQGLPEIILEAVDYDSDGRADFTLELNTIDNRVQLHSERNKDFILMDKKLLVFEESRSIRVKIKRRRSSLVKIGLPN